MDFSIISEIVNVSKRLYSAKMVNAYEGNISVKNNGLIYITPAKVNKGTLREEQICVLDENDKQIYGSCAPSSELIMHKCVYEAHPRASAVFHTHSPYLTAFAMCGKPIDDVPSPEMIALYGSIKVAPYGRPGTAAIVENALEIIIEDDIVLLENHGALVSGTNLEEAYNRIEAAEALAQLSCLMKQVGQPKPLPQSEIEYFRTIYNSSHPKT